ncbi:type II toxin-antitoxin system HicA family toxin [Methanofollis sp. W23]|uniref:type II toxin-antitoxin system HicA family toxin n=1 Tax=Methanofollis sp. W23 TaxID=2817849 RepID=UPI001FD94E94|nr:type II toxin-antitoxin system HicA family toxin [Methanofollis sp. W23]
MVRTRVSHHLYRHPETGRRVTVPDQAKDPPTGTLLEILRQAGIKREDLEDLT